MNGVARCALIIAAGTIGGAVTPHRVVAQDSGFVAWPRELASRAPGLADGIAREFGQRPRMIRFGGRDTIQILFWNPKIWQDDMDSKVLPDTSTPIVGRAARDVAAYVWSTFGRDAGITFIRIAFMRVVHDNKYLRPNHEVPAEEASASFTREMIERGQLPAVAISIREGGALAPKVQKWLDSLNKPWYRMRDTVLRDVGQLPSDVKFLGRDTVDVLFWNPTFWWSDNSKNVPEESLPIVRQTAKRAAERVWTRYGRDAGVNVIRVRFTRVLSVTEGNVRRMFDAQDVTAQFTRKQLEAGRLDSVQLTIVQR